MLRTFVSTSICAFRGERQKVQPCPCPLYDSLGQSKTTPTVAARLQYKCRHQAPTPSVDTKHRHQARCICCCPPTLTSAGRGGVRSASSHVLIDSRLRLPSGADGATGAGESATAADATAAAIAAAVVVSAAASAAAVIGAFPFTSSQASSSGFSADATTPPESARSRRNPLT